MKWDPWLILLAVQVVLAVAWFGYRLKETVPGFWKTNDRFNSTADWTPGAPYRRPANLPRANSIYEPSLRVATAHLEEGEELEGFARGFFSPPRPRDWNRSFSTSASPLLLAATRQRLLLFEVSLLGGVEMWKNPNEVKVLAWCSIPLETIEYISPPKGGFTGTGRLRFGLVSGREYQMGFLSPMLNSEAMEQEQRLAAYLRVLAPRYPSAPVGRAA